MGGLSMAAAKLVALSEFNARAQAAAPEAFRDAMRELASGVALLTSVRAGCAVSSFASLSLSPASLLVCLNGESATLSAIRASGVFAVNILGARHQPLAQRFASSKIRGADRFAEGEWGVMETGAPTLRDALAVIDCRLERVVEHATHVILIGLAVALAKGAQEPALLHWRSRFEALA